jgi:UDP-N-acetylmuramoylalanine--D-glutamate ligase
MTPADFAVVNAHSPDAVKFSEGVAARKLTFGHGSAVDDGVRDLGGKLTLRWNGAEETYEVNNKALRGAHNRENAMAALLLARAQGVAPAQVQDGLDHFPGLAHRLEFVRALDGVEWINDSKATNVDSTLVALRSFEQGVILIAGGRGKGAPYDPLVALAKQRVRAVLSIGEDAPAVEAAFQGVVPVVACRELATAVKRAKMLAKPGDTVLLSPACASYDQFKHFEHRGDTFKALVGAL